MIDWLSVLVSGLVAFVVSFLVIYVRYILIDKRQYERAEQRKTVIDRLEKLYSPLFTFIQTAKLVPARMSDKQLLAFGIGKPERTGFDDALMHYYYLAKDKLKQLLLKVHIFGIVQLTDDDATQIVNLIENDYDNLRDEYYNV